jgi:hypothetical protein
MVASNVFKNISATSKDNRKWHCKENVFANKTKNNKLTKTKNSDIKGLESVSSLIPTVQRLNALS